MKKIYIKPDTETVNVRLYSSVLKDPGEGYWSNGADELGGKEQDGFFETDGSFGDIWSDPNAGNDPYDLWGDN